jgi:hypothetical protein
MDSIKTKIGKWKKEGYIIEDLEDMIDPKELEEITCFSCGAMMIKIKDIVHNVEKC